jgi:hypothetical protein
MTGHELSLVGQRKIKRRALARATLGPGAPPVPGDYTPDIRQANSSPIIFFGTMQALEYPE